MAKRREATRSAPSGTVALGYARVSTTEQADSGLGLDAQRAAINAECLRRGWTLQSVATDVASGKSTKGRPKLAEVLTSLDEGTAGVLVVAKLDRLARSTLDFATIAERAERRGWGLVALDANVDTTSPTGRLMLDVVAAFAAYERRLIAQRTRSALRAKKAQGTRLGGPIRLPQSVRDRVRAERDAGRTLQAIADGLNGDGVATAKGGSRWYPSTVRAVLSSLDLDLVAT